MSERKRSAGQSKLEWISAAIGALLALGILGFIGWEAATGDSGNPPVLVVEPQRMVPTAGGYVVELIVRNRSDATAAGVQVIGELKQGDETVETSEAVIDYVPGRSHRRAGLVFSRNPAAYRLVVRAGGYQEP